MKKATILGALALLVVVTALLAGPALSSPSSPSSPSSQQVTVKGLARQVNSLKGQVKALRGQVAATKSVADDAEGKVTALATCLHVIPVTDYGDYVGTNAPRAYGYGLVGTSVTVAAIDTGGQTFGLTNGLDVTDTGDPVTYYLATVAASCIGSFRMAAHAQAVPQR